MRDYKLFAIACEGGKREPEYFRLFEHMSRKVTVDIIEDKISAQALKHKYETKSAPKWVLDRAVKSLPKAILNAEKADTNGTYFLSNPGEKKVYQLGKALIQVIGKNDFETFLQTKLIELSKK